MELWRSRRSSSSTATARSGFAIWRHRQPWRSCSNHLLVAPIPLGLAEALLLLPLALEEVGCAAHENERAQDHGHELPFSISTVDAHPKHNESNQCAYGEK